MGHEKIPVPELPRSSRLESPHPIEGPMKEAKASFYELARSRVRIVSWKDYKDWTKKFGFQGKLIRKSPAVSFAWPRVGEAGVGINRKNITHLEIMVNREKFLIDGEDFSDILPFVIEHELYEGWQAAKKGLGDGSIEKGGGYAVHNAKHLLAQRREFLLAEKAGLGDRLLRWHGLVDPKHQAECAIVLDKIRQRLRINQADEWIREAERPIEDAQG